MASTAESFESKQEEPTSTKDGSDDITTDVEPGSSRDSILLTTDDYDELARMIDAHNERQRDEASAEQNSTDSIGKQMDELSIDETQTDTDDSVKQDADECLSDPEWQNKEKHVFILSEAGKPVYSRHGSEDKLVTIFGVMQALVSFVHDDDDTIKYITAGTTRYVFVVKSPLILVAVSRTSEAVPQIVMQLMYMYNQIISVLTSTQLHKIFAKRRNYDLRRLLAGSERLLDHLINYMEQEPPVLLGAVQCLPLIQRVRDGIADTIIQYCSKIKNLVFAILIANNQLVALVRMKKYSIHPSDLHLIFNLVNSSESFKTAESWTPICLPKFDSHGFLHSHVSYLAEDCQACLLLLTVERDIFFTLSEAKQKIVERLRRHNWLKSINVSLQGKGYRSEDIGIPDLRHFLYKSKSTAQYTSPEIGAPYNTEAEHARLLGLYQYLHHRIHLAARPLKLLFRATGKEATIGWTTNGFELYAVFEPLVSKIAAINAISDLLNWIRKEEDQLFIRNAPTF